MNARRRRGAEAVPSALASRRGYTLLEVAAVVALLSLMAVVAGLRFRPQSLGTLGARVDARCLATDLIQARRRAIVSGENHLLAFERQRGQVAQYTVSRRLGDGSLDAVDQPRTLPTGVTVTVEPGDPEFDSRGLPLEAYVITFTAPDVTRRVTVARATGSVYVDDL